MIRKIALLAVVSAAVASPAFAAADTASIRVSLVGKDRATIVADVTAAANTLCRDLNLSRYEQRRCAMKARTEALAKVARLSTRDQMAAL